VQPSRWRARAASLSCCRRSNGQTTTSPGKIKLHRPDKWPVIRAEQTGYDPACRIVHTSMGSAKRSRNFAGRPSLLRYPHEKPAARVTYCYSTSTTNPVPQPGQQLVSCELHIGAFAGFEQSMN